MRPIRSLPLVLAGAALFAVTACSSGETADAGDAEMAEAAAETASSQELACFLRAESMQAAQERPSPL